MVYSSKQAYAWGQWGNAPHDPRDFLWLMTEEPHCSRRMDILETHPEVTKLMGHTALTKFVVLFVVGLQLFTARTLAHTMRLHPFSWQFLLVSYAIGGTANHNLVFKDVWANRALAVFANLPIGVPYAAAFKVRVPNYNFTYLPVADPDFSLAEIAPRKGRHHHRLLLLNNVLERSFSRAPNPR
jgi:sphingolipid delta-4 desaturase